MAGVDNLKPIKDSKRAKELGAKGGRAKKGSKHISTHIQEMMSDESFEQKLKDGTILKGAPLDAILKVAIAKARSGDPKFFDMLMKYGWAQKYDITSDDKPIVVEVLKFAEPDKRDNTTTTV